MLNILGLSIAITVTLFEILFIIILCTNKYIDNIIYSLYKDWKGWK